MSSFHVDARVSVKLEYELAVRLGEFLLQSGTEDKQILALGHKLNNLENDEDDTSQPVRFSSVVSNSYKSYKKEGYRDFGKNWKDESNYDESTPNNKIQIRRRSGV